MARLYIALAFFAAIAFCGYVAFAPNVPAWVRHLFHVMLGLIIVGMVAGISWGVSEFIARTA